MPNPHARFVIAATWLVVIQAGAQISLPLPAEIDKSDAEYSAAGDKLNSDRRTVQAVCDEKMGNAKDVCIQEAKVRAAYDVATQKCDDHSGAEKITCKSQARAQRAKGMTDIKAMKKQSLSGSP
jgi:hypothetical protein